MREKRTSAPLGAVTPLRIITLSKLLAVVALITTASTAAEPSKRASVVRTKTSTVRITDAPIRTGSLTARWSDDSKQRFVTNRRSTSNSIQVPQKRAWQNRDSQRAEVVKSEPKRRYDVVPAQFIERVTDDTPARRAAPRSQLAPIDPFDDPFGDRQTPITPELPAPPNYPTSVSPSDLTPTTLQPAPIEPAPEEDDTDAAPLPPPESADPLREADPEDNCTRLYNGRNCCRIDESCQKARQTVGNSSIRDISVDITPRLTVARLAMSEGSSNRTYEQELELGLAESPSRIWRNRRGEVLADGNLVDFREGSVVVRESDGNTVRIPFYRLSEDDNCFVTAWWSIPSECTMGVDRSGSRHWLATTMTWKASALCHKPLYFEDVQLERYGHSAGPVMQPVLSGAHFFLNVAALPYKMGINPPNECRYALGYYRPGNCAPWLLPPIPLSVRGALLEAGAIVGGIYILP